METFQLKLLNENMAIAVTLFLSELKMDNLEKKIRIKNNSFKHHKELCQDIIWGSF